MAAPRAFVTSSGWPPGIDAAAHAVGDGRDADAPRRSAALPHRRSRPRRRCRGSAAGARRPRAAPRSGRSRRCRARHRDRRRPTGTEPVPTLKNSSIGTSTYVGPRWDDRAAVNASWKPAATSLAVIRVAACLVTGPTIGRWSISWRAPRAPAVVGSATADDDHRRAGELGLGHRADAVGHARSGGQYGEAGHPGELAGGLGRERGRLLVAYVEQPHRPALFLRLHRAVVHREDVGAGQREHGLHAVRLGDGDGELPGVAGEFGRGHGPQPTD